MGGSPYLRLKPFSEKMIVIPKSRFWRLSLGMKRSSLAFFREIATHLSGARNDMSAKGSPFLPRDLGDSDSVRAILRITTAHPIQTKGGFPNGKRIFSIPVGFIHLLLFDRIRSLCPVRPPHYSFLLRSGKNSSRRNLEGLSLRQRSGGRNVENRM